YTNVLFRFGDERTLSLWLDNLLPGLTADARGALCSRLTCNCKPLFHANLSDNARSRYQRLVGAGWERLNVKSVFLALAVKEQPVTKAIVLRVAAVLCIALTKRGRPSSGATQGLCEP